MSKPTRYDQYRNEIATDLMVAHGDLPAEMAIDPKRVAWVGKHAAYDMHANIERPQLDKTMHAPKLHGNQPEESKYEYDTEMAADVDALAFARKALADNDEWLAANDLDGDRSSGGAIEAIAAVLVAYAGFGLFVAAVFWMAKL